MVDNENIKQKVMIDNCVLSTGISDPARWRRIDSNPNSFCPGNKLLIYEIEQLSESQRREMSEVLAIGRAVRDNVFQAYDYTELMWEIWQGYHSYGNNLSPLAAFRDTQFESVPAPIERGKLFSSANWVKGEEVELFMDFLLKVDPADFHIKVQRMAKFTEFELNNAKNISVFQQMCDGKALGRKRARDAYHLWAAECSGIGYFLTVDKKFLNPYRTAVRDKKISLKCRAVSPSELIEELGISTEGIFIPESGKRFFMSGCPVAR